MKHPFIAIRWFARSISTTGLVLLLVGILISCDRNNPDKGSSGISLHTGLGGDASGFKRACGLREFSFPQDHGAHPEYRNEWWYITGNLENSSSERFGFQITFFRIANSPLDTRNRDVEADSAWSSNEFYMAHFAITSAADKKIRYFERFGRAAAGLAGAISERVAVTANSQAEQNPASTKVWLDDWQLSITESDQQTGLTVSLSQDNSSLELALVPQKPMVLQGQKGYSQKSADPCNSSYYYALTRLTADGTLVFDGETHTVAGTAWLDREWSSSALADDQAGWDWFALQLDDGRDIMLYQLRKQDGSVDEFSHAVEINSRGKKREIPLSDWKVEVDEWWQSDTGARYPVAGKVRFSDSGEIFVFKPLINDQELNLTVRYWEGAIKLSDEAGTEVGRGYMELTGY